MKDQVRIGFIGVGGIAQLHLKQLAEIDAAQLVALCDVREEAAQHAAEQYGGTVYTDHRAMYDAEELDAVYICIPPKFHTDQETLAAAKGCALFVEKPVALSMDQALEVADAIERAGVLSAVGYTLRYREPYAAAHEYLAGKRASLVSVHRWGGIPGGEDHWWRNMDVSGGQLVEQATHQLDSVRWMLGEITQVWARYEYQTLSHLPNMTIPASQMVGFEMASGAVGTITCSCAMHKGGGGGDFDIVLDGERVNVGGKATLKPAPEGSDGTLTSSLPDINIDEGFVRAVQSGDGSSIRSPYADGLRTLEVTLAANESAATGKVVECKAWR